MQINEIFSSIEGEGIRTGYLVTFIRSFRCNLLCRYCDTLYAVQPEKIGEKTENSYIDMTVDEIIEKCKKLGNKRITFTGGEPLIQPEALELISKLTVEGFEVNIETNGAVDLAKFVKFNDEFPIDYKKLIITMDWKSPYSGMRDKMITENLYKLSEVDVLKFVVANKEDLDDMKEVIKDVDCNIFVSPVFGQIEPKEIVEYLKENNLQNVRMQLQLHKYIWPVDMRGV